MPAPKNSPATFNIPLGPVHVALEEPVYFDLQVDGEIIRGATLHSGHVHRGMENLAQHRNLIMNQTLTERVCSLCSNSHAFTYAMVVENALGIEVPERAHSENAYGRNQACCLSLVQPGHSGPSVRF